MQRYEQNQHNNGLVAQTEEEQAAAAQKRREHLMKLAKDAAYSSAALAVMSGGRVGSIGKCDGLLRGGVGSAAVLPPSASHQLFLCEALNEHSLKF